MFKLIVAVAEDWGIGYKGDLLARISTDLKRFKELTTNNAVLMGYNTLLSLPGGKPLKNRENIVLYPDDMQIDGAKVVHSLDEAVDVCMEIKDKDVFVIGGGSVYNQLLPYCDTAYITKIDKKFEADTFIPDLDKLPDWYVDEESEQYYDTDGTPYRYVTYKRKKTVVLIGAGMMSSALSVPAADNGAEVRIVILPHDKDVADGLKRRGYHKNLKRVLPCSKYYDIKDLDKALDGAYHVVCGVSSFGAEWFCGEVIPRLKPGTRVLSVAKGLIDNGDGTISDYVEMFESANAPGVRFAAIGGACISYELCDQNNTLVTYCSKKRWVCEEFADLFETEYYHINTSTDVRGVEVAVAVKNAYALAVSMAVGMARRCGGDKPKYSTEAALFAQSAYELRKLLRMFGGEEDAYYLGLGDMFVSTIGGRTREMGALIGEGLSVNEALDKMKGVTIESVAIIKIMYSVLQKKAENKEISEDAFPLMTYIGAIVNGERPADIPWNKFKRNDVI